MKFGKTTGEHWEFWSYLTCSGESFDFEQINHEQIYQNGILSFQLSFLWEKTWSELILFGFFSEFFEVLWKIFLNFYRWKKRKKTCHFCCAFGKVFFRTLSGKFSEILSKHILYIRREISGKISFWTNIILWMSFRIISGTFSDFEQKVTNRVGETVFYKCGGNFW